jgi:surface carbohydrate biosynthesis protein (TIGR04326 family)
MPGTPVYGFYHIAPPPNVLCFFIDRNELEYIPLPEKIICNGTRYKQILIEEHFPENTIEVGPALRYLYLYNIKKALRSNANDFSILLVLPIERDASIELFYKLRKAMNSRNNIKLIIKPHPMGTTIIEELKSNFPPTTEIFEGTMEEAINQCDIVVSAATSAVLDCVIANKEVIRVGRSTQIDLDPLAWFEEFGKPVSDIDTLKAQLISYERKIKGNSYVPPQYSLLLPELFSQLTDENLKVFLP